MKRIVDDGLGPFARVRLSRLGPDVAGAATRHFHVKRAARDRSGLGDELFAVRGDVVFADQYAAHAFAAALEAGRQVPDAQRLQPAQLVAMALVHEIAHVVLAQYREAHPGVLGALAARLRASLGDRLGQTLHAFISGYPPPDVYRGRVTAETHLGGARDGLSGEEEALEELLLLWLTNQNPACAPIAPLVDDAELRQRTAYDEVVAHARRGLEGAPRFGPAGESILELLLAPIRHSPTSLTGQLAYMKERWGLLLAPLGLLDRILRAEGLIREEGAWFERRAHGAPGAAPAHAPTFLGGAEEPERFSPDTDWMPRVVLIAKSTFVWLDQLSKRYGRAITRLDQIPDEELDVLAARGLNSLWLIGVWRRSAASQRIKQRMGDPDAAPSAYSLHDYEIAPELGGFDAYAGLRDRAARRGVRLASDMVPNHTGLESSWVMNHPDRFIQVSRPPFPGYTFDGPDLSGDQRVGVFLEDGYWTKRDAAVVFKRLDRGTGDVRYLYHGNDGTHMPWNDTAQLDYTRAEVREAVIQTILHVARLFPIIRFDAAMTLAKRHFQRLWFPLPGAGGDIPSRAEHALAREEFERLFPVELWREVVDRVAAEAPDTLLLAEAFWMMEGYFVRTLGMHRVYNSAFMNMLKREDNAAFRATLKNVLEFEPQILQRFVNFMNNPDEEPAVAQFGRDDKYFGVCTLMSTLPGLPMFGHGQIEGFAEKYGMEFRRARLDEVPDEWLVARHEREIFPLLRQRWLFSGAERFFLYDLVTVDGAVNEDVIAFSNRVGDARALVVFHNRWAETRGHLKTSVAAKAEGGGLVSTDLVHALGLEPAPGRFVVMRDHQTGLEHLERLADLTDRGLYVELGAFKYRVLLELRVLEGSETIEALAHELGRRGVPSIAEALVELHLRPVLIPFRAALAPAHAAYLRDAPAADRERAFRERFQHALDGLVYMGLEPAPGTAAALDDALVRLGRLGALEPAIRPEADPRLLAVNAWLFASALEAALGDRAAEVDLRGQLAPALAAGGLDEGAARAAATLARLLLATEATPAPLAALRALLAHDEARQLLGVHEAGGEIWFVKEPYEVLAGVLVARATLAGLAAADAGAALRDAGTRSGYRLDALVDALEEKAPAAGHEGTGSDSG